jgi:hypothetical protein
MSYPFLTISRARSIIWPGSQQTMGELLDQDKLTSKMLRQIADCAENELARAAAEVLLADRENKIREYIDNGNIPRNIDEAAAVKIENNGNRETIKSLWYKHNGCMNWERLHTLMGETRSAQVRSACVILLGYHYQVECQKILDGKGPLVVTSSKNSYLLNKTEGYLVKEGAVVGFVLGLCMAYLLWYAYKVVFVYDFTSLKDFNWLAWVIIAAITVISLVIGFFIIIKPLEKIVDSLESKVSSFKKGFEGEDHVVNALRESLDGSCHIFRNLHFNGRKEDIDVALVSPWGVFAIEVKNRCGTFEYSGSDFYEKRKTGYEKVDDDSNPIKQAKRNASALKEFLDPEFNRNKERAFVEPVIVWANPEIKVYHKKTIDSQDSHSQEIKCWRIEDLSFELDSIRCKKSLSEKAQREIIKKLEGCY